MPGQPRRSCRNLRSRGGLRRGIRLLTGVFNVALDVGQRLPQVSGRRVACGAAVVGGDGIDDPPVLAASMWLTSIEAREHSTRDEDVRPESVVQRGEPPI